MQELILEKARELFFSYGVRSVTMDDIARKAGVSKKTVYQFFTDKADMVHTIVEDWVDCHRAAVKKCVSEAHNAIEELVLHMEAPYNLVSHINPGFFYELEKTFLNSWQVLQTYREKEVANSIVKNLKKGIAEELYRTDLDIELTTRIRLQQFDTALNPAGFLKENSKPRLLMQELTVFFLHAVTTTKGSKMINKYLKQLNAKK